MRRARHWWREHKLTRQIMAREHGKRHDLSAGDYIERYLAVLNEVRKAQGR